MPDVLITENIVGAAMDAFRVNDAVKLLYDFLWKDFCDWYVEFVKNRIQETSDVQMRREDVMPWTAQKS